MILSYMLQILQFILVKETCSVMFPKRRITSIPTFKFLFQERTIVLVDTRKAIDYFSTLIMKRLCNRSIFMRILYK